jgi:hypothetical protein
MICIRYSILIIENIKEDENVIPVTGREDP